MPVSGAVPPARAQWSASRTRATNRVRAKVTERLTSGALQGFVVENVNLDAEVYSDEASAYEGLPHEHESVKHSVHEYVKGAIHTNGVESFWSMLKRAHKGTFHKLSPKHLDRYVQGVRRPAQCAR